VAAAVSAYQAGVQERLHRAELERAEAQVKAAEERKRRKLTLALARRRAELRQGVERGLEQAGALREQARWREARAVLGQLEQRLGERGPEDLRQKVAQARQDLDVVDRLDAIHLQQATLVEGTFDDRPTDRDYAAVFAEAGLAEPAEEPAAVAERLRASAIKAQLVAALDDWALVTPDRRRRAWLLEVARLADPNPWRDRFRDSTVWKKRAELERLGREADVEHLSPQLLTVLGALLANHKADAVPLLTAAQRRHPHDFRLNFVLGNALLGVRPEEAIGYYRAALAVRPQTSAVYNNLGNALAERKRRDEALACFEKALSFDPTFAPAHYNLGNALADEGRLDEAIAAYERAVQLAPNYAKAHTNLGLALYARRRLDEAIAAYERVIQVDPKLALAHYNLGNALKAKGRLDDAIASYQRAVELDPNLAPAYYNLGNALKSRGRLDDAIAAYHRAVALAPDSAKAHSNLGLALYDRRRLDEAIACHEKAIHLAPTFALAHTNLGVALTARGRLDDALTALRGALELDPKLPTAHIALGQALLRLGRFAEARSVTRSALDLLPNGDPLHALIGPQLQECERLLRLDQLLPRVLHPAPRVSDAWWVPADDRGNPAPATCPEADPLDASVRADLAQFCAQHQQLPAAAVSFFAEAFAEQPSLAEDLQRQYRYGAACAAVRAAAGRGKDAGGLTDDERARLRQQALNWLRADLTAYGLLAEEGTPPARAAVATRLLHWQQDADLDAVRDTTALARLPAVERTPWRQLWDDAAQLLKNVQDRK
jgi:tetratricopeptide (TPR) repeat protein